MGYPAISWLFDSLSSDIKRMGAGRQRPAWKSCSRGKAQLAWQAVLGGKVTVPTLNGEQKVALGPGTQPGTVKILRNHGAKNLQGDGYGNLVVEFQELLVVGQDTYHKSLKIQTIQMGLLVPMHQQVNHLWLMATHLDHLL